MARKQQPKNDVTKKSRGWCGSCTAAPAKGDGSSTATPTIGKQQPKNDVTKEIPVGRQRRPRCDLDWKMLPRPRLPRVSTPRTFPPMARKCAAARPFAISSSVAGRLARPSSRTPRSWWR